MPVWNEGRGGFAPQGDDTRDEVVLDHNFSVLAGRTKTFRDTILWVRPSRRDDIEIFGTLILEDCLLLWDQSEHQQTRLRVKNGGTLQITDCYAFSANGFWVNWEFEHGSNIQLDAFVGDPWTSIWGSVQYESENFSTVKMTLQDSTRGTDIRIRDAHHLWLEIFPPLRRSVDLSFAAKRQWVDWSIDTMWPSTTVRIEDSYLYQRDISLGPGNHVTVRDTVDGFSIGWTVYKNSPGFVTCELVGLGTPGHDDGTYYENQTWSLPAIDSSLTIVNSRLERAWPTTWGNMHLIVRDSHLADPRVWDGPATYEIYGSTIDHAAVYRGGRMYLEDCVIRHDLEAKDVGSAIYGYGLIGTSTWTPFEIFELDGGRFVELETPGPPW